MKEKSLLYPGTQLCPEMSFWSLMFDKPLRHCVEKWCPAVLLTGKRTVSNSGGDTQHRGSETAVQLILLIALADATALQNGAVSFPNGTTRGFEAGLT